MRAIQVNMKEPRTTKDARKKACSTLWHVLYYHVIFCFVCFSNLKHQPCFCPCQKWAGVQARLSKDGSSLSHMVSAGQLDGLEHPRWPHTHVWALGAGYELGALLHLCRASLSHQMVSHQSGIQTELFTWKPASKNAHYF